MKQQEEECSASLNRVYIEKRGKQKNNIDTEPVMLCGFCFKTKSAFFWNFAENQARHDKTIQ